MFTRSREKRRIEAIKLHGDVQRSELALSVVTLVPVARKALHWAIYAAAIKRFAPAVRPIIFGLIQRGLANRGRTGLFKLAGLLSTVVGMARAFSSSDSKAEKAALK